MRADDLERFFDEQREWAQARSGGARGRDAGAGHPHAHPYCNRRPHRGIVETAKREGAAFIVMGTHGRGAFERFFLAA